MNQVTEIILGALLPPLIDVLNRKVAKANFRYLISIGICLVIGAVLNLGDLKFESLLESGALVFGSAQTVYKLYWSNSGQRKSMMKLMDK